MPKFGWAWTIGCSLGFEFMDTSFMGGGWVVHLGFLKILYFKDMPPDLIEDRE